MRVSQKWGVLGLRGFGERKGGLRNRLARRLFCRMEAFRRNTDRWDVWRIYEIVKHKKDNVGLEVKYEEGSESKS